jgi:hypothetical protein
MSESRDLKRAFEQSPSVFQTLAAQRTHRVFKGFSKDISRPELHGGTGRTLEMRSPYMQPEQTALSWQGDDLAEVDPISELETALLLWAACGPNGIVSGDIGINENLSTMVCMAGRTVPGPCNDAALNVVFANDDGTFLYKPGYERERPVEIESAADYDKVLRWFREGTTRLSDRRPDFDWSVNPGRPHGIYQVNSNKPGSTVFIPVYATAHELINYLFAGFEWLGWYFVDEETGQPAGCGPWADDPAHHLRIPYTLRQYEQFLSISEANPAGMAVQNLRLAAESLGLGSWNHSANMDLLFGGQDAVYQALGLEEGEYTSTRGLGFTYTTANGANNYVGIPGVLEGKGLPAPWNESPERVVEEVFEDKYKQGVFFSDGTEFLPIDQGPWKAEIRDAIRRHPRSRIPDWCVDASKSVVRYCFDKWGRYPVYFSDFQNSYFMIEVGVVDDRFYDEKNVSGFINERIRRRSSRHRPARRAA